MKVIGMVSGVQNEMRTDQDSGREYAVRSVTIEGLRCKVGGKLELPLTNREIEAAVATQWKKRQAPKPDGSDDIFAEYHLAGWQYTTS